MRNLFLLAMLALGACSVAQTGNAISDLNQACTLAAGSLSAKLKADCAQLKSLTPAQVAIVSAAVNGALKAGATQALAPAK